MNYRKVALILMLPFLLEPLVGCYGDDDDDYTHHYYRDLVHCGLTVAPLDNRGASPELSDAEDEFLEEAFGLNLRVMRQEDQGLCFSSPGRLSFFPAAKALGPLHTHIFHYTLLDQIEKIEIKTVNAFSSDRPAGSDVTDLFGFRKGFEYYSAQDYISLLPSEFTTESDYERHQTIQIFLMEPPGYASYFQFDVFIHISDGRVIQTTTEQYDLV
jgi:hypothetical protein